MGPGLRPGAIQPRRLARPGGTWSPSADGEIPLLKPGVRPGFQPKNKKNRSPQRAKYSAAIGRSWERPSFRTAFPFSLPRLRQPERRECTNGRRGENQPVGWFSMSALCARSFSRPEGRDYFFVLVDFPSREIGKIKRGFRALRSTAQGSALRTRSL